MQEGSARWVQAGILIRDFAALDFTVIQHDGRWWLFCSCQDDLRDAKLYIWHADDLFGPWEQHASNPGSRTRALPRPLIEAISVSIFLSGKLSPPSR